MELIDLNKRYDDEVIKKLYSEFESPLLKAMDMVHSMVLILNETSQIIFANKEMLKAISFKNLDDVLGKRTGEIIKCVHSEVGAFGCGTSEKCKQCSALNIIMNTISRSENIIGIAQILTAETKFGAPMEYVISSEVYKHKGKEFFVLTFVDNRTVVRKNELERIFYHDVLNSMGGIKGIFQLINQDKSCEGNIDFEFVDIAFTELIEMIEMQRKVSLSEEGTIEVSNNVVDANEIMMYIKQLFLINDDKNRDRINLNTTDESIKVMSDRVVLNRILHNMIKNALEATDEKEKIAIGTVKDEDGYITFWVWNPGFINASEMDTIFNKAVSTKGTNRGWGTFSMKLLGEVYLKGQVTCETDVLKGTKFSLKIPISI